MTNKKVVIEDDKNIKYYPVTHVKNIIGLEEIEKYIDLNIDVENIIIDKESEGNLKDNITNINNTIIKNENNIKKFNNDLNNLKSEDEKINKEINSLKLEDQKINKEIDNLKQCGTEINKILVDALSSKNVKASTTDNLKTNANKVNDISGLYNKGDVLGYNSISEYIGTTKIWSSDIDKTIYDFDVDKYNNTYVLTSSSYIKLDINGKKIWERGLNSYVTGISLFEDGTCVIGFRGTYSETENQRGYIVYNENGEIMDSNRYLPLVSFSADRYGEHYYILYYDRIQCYNKKTNKKEWEHYFETGKKTHYDDDFRAYAVGDKCLVKKKFHNHDDGSYYLASKESFSFSFSDPQFVTHSYDSIDIYKGYAYICQKYGDQYTIYEKKLNTGSGIPGFEKIIYDSNMYNHNVKVLNDDWIKSSNRFFSTSRKKDYYYTGKNPVLNGKYLYTSYSNEIRKEKFEYGYKIK